jgi:predicted Fe-S protein YdhL (DUF1289 family)
MSILYDYDQIPPALSRPFPRHASAFAAWMKKSLVCRLFRTIDELTGWSTASNPVKLQIWRQVKERMFKPASGKNPMPDTLIQLPASMRVFERGWLSSNNILFMDDDTAALVDSGYVTHAPQTLALLQHALQGRALDLLLNTHLHSDHCGGNALLQQTRLPHLIPLRTCLPWRRGMRGTHLRRNRPAVRAFSF